MPTYRKGAFPNPACSKGCTAMACMVDCPTMAFGQAGLISGSNNCQTSRRSRDVSALAISAALVELIGALQRGIDRRFIGRIKQLPGSFNKRVSLVCAGQRQFSQLGVTLKR